VAVIFSFAPMVAAEAEMINAWRWPNVHPDRPGLKFGDASFTARDEDGTVVASCTFGELPGFDGERYVAVAAGIHPDLVGGGRGRAFMAAVLDLGRREFPKQNLLCVGFRGNARHSLSQSALHAHDRARGVRLIAGVDEVGAGGCWAGPIVAAGVLFDLERLASAAGRDLLDEVNDSKRLAPAKRERLAKAVLCQAEAVSLVSISPSQIDRIGLRAANLACLEQALRAWGNAQSFASWTAMSSAPARRCTSGSCVETERAQRLPRPRSWPRSFAIASWLA
jgi:Ribonuclease HII